MNDDKTWSQTHVEPATAAGQAAAAITWTEPEKVYTFENNETGERVSVSARSAEQAGEKLAEGKGERK